MDEPRIVALGDSAVLVEFSTTLDLATNARIQRLARAIRAHPDGTGQWIRDVVPALGSLAIHFTADAAESHASPRGKAMALIRECLAAERAAAPDARGARRDGAIHGDKREDGGRVVEIPVCYDTSVAPDLHDVASRCALDVADVVARHCASPNRVLMVGFVPGHPYIGGLDASLSVPRRATPRPKVVAGSIAIANAQTVIYPFAIPGGWSIIGRTPLRMFDAMRDPPAILAPGDRVSFVPIDLDRYDTLARDNGTAPR